MDQGTQGQPEHNQHEEDNTSHTKDSGKGSKGKKSKKKSSHQPGPTSPCPGMSTGKSTEGNTIPRTDFSSGIWILADPPFSVQCVGNTVTGAEHVHTTSAPPAMTTHMQHTCVGPLQSPSIYIYCGGMDHRSANCHNRPWDTR